MEDRNGTWLNSLNGDKFYCSDYNFICREVDSTWKYIKKSADISGSARQTMMGFFWGERALWGGNKLKLPPFIITGVRFCVFCDASCIQGTSGWLTWLNSHVNSNLLLQDFIINFFIFYVYMVILLFQQLKLALTENYLQEGKKTLLFALSNSNSFLFKAAHFEKWVTDFKPQMQLLLFSQKFHRFVFWNMSEKAKEICWLCN